MGRREQRKVSTEPWGKEGSGEKRAPYARARGRWRRMSLLPHWALELNREVVAPTGDHCFARCPGTGWARRTSAGSPAIARAPRAWCAPDSSKPVGPRRILRPPALTKRRLQISCHPCAGRLGLPFSLFLRIGNKRIGKFLLWKNICSMSFGA